MLKIVLTIAAACVVILAAYLVGGLVVRNGYADGLETGYDIGYEAGFDIGRAVGSANG